MDYQELASDLVKKALNKGASEAEVYIESGDEFSLKVRKGKVDILKQSSKRGLGLRVLVKGKQGFSYSSDFTEKNLNDLVGKSIFFAQQASSDDFNGLPSIEQMPEQGKIPDLKIYDSKVKSLDTEKKIELAKRAEDAAFSYSPKIKNSEGANFYNEETNIILSNSQGKTLTFDSTNFSLSCDPVAEEKGEKRIDSWWDSKRFFGELLSPEEIGKKAAYRATRMLGAREIKSQKVPVILENQCVTNFLWGLAAAVNGENIYKQSSFLSDYLDKKIGSEKLTILDDGTMFKGLGSRPFDGEGILTQIKTIIDKGILTSFLYDTYYAKKTKKASTGNASRGYSSLPDIGPLNFYIEKGNVPFDQLIKKIKKGFLVTNLAGFGINWITGDFSQMAEGLWIENGEIAFPVDKVTLGGTLLGLLNSIEEIGEDLEFRGSVSSPSILVSEVILGGV
jgi:PmbA protein